MAHSGLPFGLGYDRPKVLYNCLNITKEKPEQSKRRSREEGKHLWQRPLLGSLSNDDVNENGKKAKGLDWQNNNFARASRFFVHFFAVTARLRHEDVYFTRFVEDVNARPRLSFSYLELSIQFFGIQLQKRLPIFGELNEMEARLRLKERDFTSVKSDVFVAVAFTVA